ncbi:venom metalloproteinase antarease-like TtrivMP_A [Rhipicephalus microplus]|uniref:venom metalloproteinase antarease-like TtrivMP_A n=1 Tax=Rhipicephalus microplus TaxID=6941 RepID=UPI003F6B41FE
MIQGRMGTFSWVKLGALLFGCFFAVSMQLVAGVKTARVVYPRLLEERSSDGRMIVKVHDGLTLNLRKGSVAAQELRVLMEENGRPVTRFYNGEDIERNLYEDEKEIASVMVTNTGNGVRMEGLLSPSHRIKPAPISEKSEDGAVPHEIHEIEYKQMLDKALYYSNNASEGVASERALESRANVPSKVTVEVFIVLDKWHHRHFQSTNHALWYICVMINSANIRYKDASNPAVQLLLTGMEKAADESFVVSPNNDNGYLLDDKTLALFKTYTVSKRTAYGDPDFAFLLTGRDVLAFYEGKLTDAGLGIAYVSGVCTNFYVGLGEDKPGLFSGTHTFTHESAHLLGAKHDGDEPYNAVPGHPGAQRCPWDDGHIMSYINKGPSHHRFSWCTLEQISFVLSRAGEKCWIVQSKGTYVKGVYPGMTVTLKQFCTAMSYEKGYTYEHSTVNETNCKVRCRFYKTYSIGTKTYKSTLTYTDDALDYMPCRDHYVCVQGVCRNKQDIQNHPVAELKPRRL